MLDSPSAGPVWSLSRVMRRLSYGDGLARNVSCPGIYRDGPLRGSAGVPLGRLG